MRNILVTGGAGFIGANFVKHMRNDRLIILDKLTYASDFKRIAHLLSNRVVFCEGDICYENFVDGLFQEYDIDIIVNFAAESHVDRSIKNVTPFIKTNVIGVQVLMDVSRKYWQDKGLFLQISTDEVYGPVASFEEMRHAETAKLNPMNPYAATKASAEHLIQSYGNTYRFPFKIVRCTNTYGDFQHEEKFIPTILKAIVSNQNIPVYGDGNYYRNWLYVGDTVEMIEYVMNHGSLGEVYNIAGPGVVSNIDLIETVIAQCKQKGIQYKGQIELVEDRKGHDFCYYVDDSKLMHLMNHKKKSISEGLAIIIDTIQ